MELKKTIKTFKFEGFRDYDCFDKTIKQEYLKYLKNFLTSIREQSKTKNKILKKNVHDKSVFLLVKIVCFESIIHRKKERR